jgi:beta-xylosidase
MIFGDDYAWVGVRVAPGGAWIVQVMNKDASKQGAERIAEAIPLKQPKVQLRAAVGDDAKCRFSYSYDGKTFTPLGEEFTARNAGRWLGAKVGVFAAATGGTEPGARTPNRSGYADFAWFRVTGP